MKQNKLIKRFGRFVDFWNGNGLYLSTKQWTFALRWKWHCRYIHPPGKSGYTRLYFGPFEIEHRKQLSHSIAK